MSKDTGAFEDLIDFYNNWPELRGSIIELLEGDKLTECEKIILRSMMHVVECVGPADLIRETK